ncbi:hypothetical protein [Rhizobium wuzhouense]|uniref:DUF2163 domain-containing protein n=1 Tax=Rhizobium wuzhouense TaxID=1986026 RepID=A0ABX5NSJ7_9HYPH|nr:hypothetical protein [Rhizobium wuzhouense]PYB71266.1 hypothetical protein DMY87_18060 [Rhizobium wuzhouense]
MAALKILVDITLPDTVLRIWDGSGGAFVDGDGNIYRAAQFAEDSLQNIEAAINGEAFTLTLSLINIDTATGDQVWDYDELVSVVGSPVVIKIQELNDLEQPVGEPEVKFTGTIDNMKVADQSMEEASQSIVTVEVVNAFTLRVLNNGQVLSDVDQKERSKRLNPFAALDRFCERVPGLRDKMIRWPSW